MFTHSSAGVEFTDGVASGDVTSTSVTIWTRVDGADGDVALTWAIEVDAPLDPADQRRSPARTGEATARAADDHTVHVVIEGLQPGTAYRYRFDAGGRSVDGRTRTLPDAADSIRFAVVCCSRWGWPGIDRYAQVVEERPAFVLHLGDYIYETGDALPGESLPDPPWECQTLDDYRRRYRSHRRHPAIAALHRELPVIAVWDDHEVTDNAPDDEGVARRRAGLRAWAEWMPMRRAERPAPLDRSVTIGGLLDLILVDARYSGRAAVDTDGPDVERDRGGLLAAEQWRRLEATVATASAPFLVLANQVQVGPMTLGAAPRAGFPPWRRIVNPDQWDGFPVERDRLYAALRRASGQAVVLSGDLHSSWWRTLTDEDGVVAHELTAPSISGESYAGAFRQRTHLPAGVLAMVLRLLNRGIEHLDLERHGYVIVDVTPDELVATIVLGDGDRRVMRQPAR